MTDHPATDGTTEDAAWERLSSVVENNGSHGSIKNAARELIRAARSAQQSAERELERMRPVVEAARKVLAVAVVEENPDKMICPEAFSVPLRRLWLSLRALDAATEGGKRLSPEDWRDIANGRDDEPAPLQTEGGESAEALRCKRHGEPLVDFDWCRQCTNEEMDALRVQLAEAEDLRGAQLLAVGSVLSGDDKGEDSRHPRWTPTLAMARMLVAKLAEAERKNAILGDGFKEASARADETATKLRVSLEQFDAVSGMNAVAMRSIAAALSSAASTEMSASAEAIRAVEANSAAGDWCAKYRAAKAELATAHAVAASIAERTAREQRDGAAAIFATNPRDLLTGEQAAARVRSMNLVTEAPSKGVPYERPAVLWFAEEMEKKLRDNDHKRHWSRCEFQYLDRRLDEEVDELKTARSRLKRGAGETVARVISEAADVANFAMMIADNARRLLTPPLVTDAPRSAGKKEVPEREQRCACGLHLIPGGIHGVNWYWATHDRDKCMLELPNVRCWCGRLRSEHQDKDGHAPRGGPFVTDAPNTWHCPSCGAACSSNGCAKCAPKSKDPEPRICGLLGAHCIYQPSQADAVAREIASWRDEEAPCTPQDPCSWCRIFGAKPEPPTCKHGAPNCTAEHE